MGMSQLQSDSGLTLLIAGIAWFIESLVAVGLFDCLLWIVDRLNDSSQPIQAESQAFESVHQTDDLDYSEPRDGLRNKPTLKRRRFS